MAKFTVNTHKAYLNNEIIIKAEGKITLVDIITGEKYEFRDELKTFLSAGKHILKSGDYEEEINIEDAIKLGGSDVKNAFVFDHNPWVFVTTKDRLYITNVETNEEKVEFNITPDEIMSLPAYVYKQPNEYFRFKTHKDEAIYNVLTGKIIYQFTNHIFSNGHLVISKKEDCIEVYDFRIGKTIVCIDGQQYSIGEKFYFVKEKQLYAMDFDTSSINKISYVGEVKDSDMLLGNHLLKLIYDFSHKKTYIYFSLGNGECENTMFRTEIKLPYYIESWNGEPTLHFKQAKEILEEFNEECSKIRRPLFKDIYNVCLGIRINNEIITIKTGKSQIKLYGEIVSYPATKFTVPFLIEGVEGKTIDFSEYVIKTPKDVKETPVSEKCCVKYTLDVNERIIGDSESGNLIITRNGEKLFLRNKINKRKCRILQNTFDISNYSDAYFTGDGKNVFLRCKNSDTQLFGFENLTTIPFEINGFTLARNEGYNSYKPEVSFSDGRKPVWRDPITLGPIPENEMSSHVFKSPDGKYIAETQMKIVLQNRLTKSEMSMDEVNELMSKYNWDSNTSEKKKEIIIGLRKKLVAQSKKNDLFGKVIEMFSCRCSDITDEKNKIENVINRYINEECDFASLIIDRLGYVCYRKKGEKTVEKSILIGRNVYYLNYISFSYDSKYLSFAAKLKKDDFRFSEEGVFEIFDLEEGKIVKRIERFDNHRLWAVWMTMFSKTGDVAFYDSSANAYLVHKSDNYNRIEEAPGKSLLCFSPSGKYIACSDQNYITYAHRPNGNWGHQPSGNVYIHTVENFGKTLEQYNDLGDGVSGVSTRARSVSSAAFSQDETKLLVVGNDGVVVVRNLKNTTHETTNTVQHKWRLVGEVEKLKNEEILKTTAVIFKSKYNDGQLVARVTVGKHYADFIVDPLCKLMEGDYIDPKTIKVYTLTNGEKKITRLWGKVLQK